MEIVVQDDILIEEAAVIPTHTFDSVIRRVRSSYYYWGIKVLVDDLVLTTSTSPNLLVQRDEYGWTLYHHLMYFQGDLVTAAVNARITPSSLMNDNITTKPRCFCFRPCTAFCTGFIWSSCPEKLLDGYWFSQCSKCCTECCTDCREGCCHPAPFCTKCCTMENICGYNLLLLVIMMYGPFLLMVPFVICVDCVGDSILFPYRIYHGDALHSHASFVYNWLLASCCCSPCNLCYRCYLFNDGCSSCRRFYIPAGRKADDLIPKRGISRWYRKNFFYDENSKDNFQEEYSQNANFQKTCEDCCPQRYDDDF